MGLAQIRALGFDLSTHVAFTKNFRVACSCCEALVINGCPTHETGCSQAVHECNGCNTLIPIKQRYCADCR